MSIQDMVRELKDDAACWEKVELEFVRLRAVSAERRRLTRMLNEIMEKEVEALTQAQLALTVIKNRQEGKSG